LGQKEDVEMRAKVLRIVFSLILAFGASAIGLVPAAAQSCVGRVIDQGTVGNSEILVFLVFCSDGSAFLMATVATENANGSLTFEIFVQPL
jgi:hypothetical protein